MKRIASGIRRHPLICYFILAYGLTLGLTYLSFASPGVVRAILFQPLVPTGLSGAPLSLFLILSNWGPSLAVVVIAGIGYGRGGIREWLARWARWRVGWKWYLIALLCGPTLFLGQNLMTRPTELLALPTHSTGILLENLATSPLFLIPFCIVNAGEEGGWRGFALPLMQKRYGPLGSSCIIAVLWEAWHLHSILQPGNPYYAQGAAAVSLHLIRMLLMCILYSILATWIFNNTRGSILPLTLWHASLNVTSDMEGNLFPATGGALPGHALGDWILWPIVAAIVVWSTRGRLGYREEEDEPIGIRPSTEEGLKTSG